MAIYKAAYVRSEPFGSLDAVPDDEAACEITVEAPSEQDAADMLFAFCNDWDPSSILHTAISHVSMVERGGRNMTVGDVAVVQDIVNATASVMLRTENGWKQIGRIRIEVEIHMESLSLPNDQPLPKVISERVKNK